MVKIDGSKFDVFEGGRVDPSDVDDRPEELEAYAIRLREVREIIDSHVSSTELDQTVSRLRNGFIVLEETAYHGGELSIAEAVRQSIAEGINRVDDGDPTSAHRHLARHDAAGLGVLGEAMFSNLADFIQKHPTEAWQTSELRDALINGIGYSASVLGILYPAREGETPLRHRHRMQDMLRAEQKEIEKLI